MRTTTALVCIVILGFTIRIWNLSEIPAGFFADEASIGYNAYTMLTKGTDEYGSNYPLFFRAFGEYKSPVQIYATIPFVALFGLNEFSVRPDEAKVNILRRYFKIKKTKIIESKLAIQFGIICEV